MTLRGRVAAVTGSTSGIGLVIARALAEAGADVETLKHAFLTGKQAMATFSTADCVGGLVVFLCSEHARTTTGAPISVDGGWVAR